MGLAQTVFHFYISFELHLLFVVIMHAFFLEKISSQNEVF